MNETIRVAGVFDCTQNLERHILIQNQVFRRTHTGCHVLLLLQEIIGFNMTHVHGDPYYENTTRLMEAGDIDVFARPMSFRVDNLDIWYPVMSIIPRRYGALLRAEPAAIHTMFYSLPFTRAVWNWLYVMACMVTLVFHLAGRWERHLVGRGEDCSLGYELLVVITAYCQHILPVRPVLTSRRIAYFSFFLFSYVIYSYYTSNLLSHLVSDRDSTMSLEELAESDYKFVTIDDFKTIARRLSFHPNLSILTHKLRKMQVVDITSGLQDVMTSKTALITDFVTLYPYIQRMFDDEEICDLTAVEFFTNLQDYLFTSLSFPYKKQFKIGAIRIKETGVLDRFLSDVRFPQPQCSFKPDTQATFSQIRHPLILLGCSYVAALIIMGIEIVWHCRTKVYPYAE